MGRLVEPICHHINPHLHSIGPVDLSGTHSISFENTLFKNKFVIFYNFLIRLSINKLSV